MSGEQFQQWSQGSPLLSLDRFHLQQTSVLNFNCRDSLGFPSYFAQKDFLFCSVCIFKCCVTFLFCCPSGLALHFQMFASFFFLLPKWLAFHDEKRFASFFFFVVWWASLVPHGSIIIFLGILGIP